MLQPSVLTRPGPYATPYTYKLSAIERMRPTAVFAHFDGTGAASAFLPSVAYYTQDGLLFSRVFPGTTVAAGGEADVSYAPFLGGMNTSTTVTPGTVPGQLAFVQLAADKIITATTQAGADVVMTAPALSFDGVTVVRVDMDALTQVDMRTHGTPAGNGGGVFIELWEDGVFYNGLIDYGVSGILVITNQSRTVYLTPSAGTHTYSIRAYRQHGAGVTDPDVTIFKDVAAGEPTFATNFSITQINPVP